MKRETNKPNNYSKMYVEALKKLTPREVQVIQRVASGLTSKEIAEELDISHRTVQKYRQNICKKLGLSGYRSLFHWCNNYMPN
jgi:DNA-binding NarL/FixJ family response regulator